MGVFFSYVFGVIFVVLASVRYIHILQLESYQNNMYVKWLIKNYAKDLKVLLLDLVSLAVAAFSAFLFYKHEVYSMETVCGFCCLIITGLIFHLYYRKPKKKPLVITDRVKRLFGFLAVFTAVALFFISYAVEFLYAVVLVLMVLAPVMVLIGNLLAYPVEAAIRLSYILEAKSILRKRSDLIKIGITGSFGKTSTKFILNTILSEKYNSLCTPGSYNTPMGLTKVIREKLGYQHDVFIAEMGARYKKDIKILCKLVKPKYGLISSIGKQHLETFKTLDNIIETKYDLIKSLPKDGIGYLPNDGNICLELFKRNDGYNKKLFSIDKVKNAEVYAKDITIDEKGSSFELVTRKLESIKVTTCLLGEHNIQNILGCAALALDLGLSLEQIKKGIEKIEPIEHRLQLLDSGNGIIVIDDAFNANPKGTKMALNVLSQFEGKKIIVTPGLVELGDETEALNKEFGKDIAKVCDVAVLVGKSFSKHIKDGLIDAGFDEDAIVEYNTLDEVTNFIGAYAKPGDIVLFENDLPDNYS